MQLFRNAVIPSATSRPRSPPPPPRGGMRSFHLQIFIVNNLSLYQEAALRPTTDLTKDPVEEDVVIDFAAHVLRGARLGRSFHVGRKVYVIYLPLSYSSHYPIVV